MTVYGPEDGPGRDARGVKPCPKRPSWARFRIRPVWNGLRFPFAFLVRLGAAQRDHEPFGRGRQVFDVEADQFRAAESADEADKEKRPVAEAGERV